MTIVVGGSEDEEEVWPVEVDETGDRVGGGGDEVNEDVEGNVSIALSEDEGAVLAAYFWS